MDSSDTALPVQDKSMWASYRQLTRYQQAIVGILVFLIPLVVVAVYQPLGIFHSNQHTYHVKGMFDAGVEWLQNDPIATSRVTHVLFAKIIFILQSMNWLAGGSQFAVALFFIIFGVSLIIMNLAIAQGWRSHQRFAAKRQIWIVAIISSVIFVFLVRRITLVDVQISVAGFYLLSRYFQPSNFGVFTFLGIGLLALQRWRLATFLFILGGMMHSIYLILTGPLMLMLAYEMYREGKLREGIVLVSIFTVIATPLFVLGPVQWSQAQSPETIYFYTHVRAPHHYDVHYWWNQEELMRIVTMGLATLLATWKLSSVFRNIMLIFFAYIVIGIAVVAATDNTRVMALLPWRASALLLPLSQIIIIASVVIIVFDLMTAKYNSAILSILCLVTVAYWVSLKPWDWEPAYFEYTSPEIEMVKENTNYDDIIMIPPLMDENFRLYAQRSTFVMWKTGDYYLDDWYARLLIADEMADASYDRQQEICSEFTFDYYLLPVDAPAAQDVTVVAQTENHLLIACT